MKESLGRPDVVVGVVASATAYCKSVGVLVHFYLYFYVVMAAAAVTTFCSRTHSTAAAKSCATNDGGDAVPALNQLLRGYPNHQASDVVTHGTHSTRTEHNARARSTHRECLRPQHDTAPCARAPRASQLPWRRPRPVAHRRRSSQRARAPHLC